MLKTLRFYAKYAVQIAMVYGAIAVLVVAGALWQGSLNGIVGTYASMLPTMGLMFGGLFAASIDLYFNVAVSMGARRCHCFWAGQLTTAVGTLLMPPLSVLVYRLLAGLPDRMEVLRDYSASDWTFILLSSLVVQQLGLLCSRIRNPKGKTAAMMAMVFVAMTLMILVTVMGVPELNPQNWGIWGGVAEHRHWVLAATAAVLAAVVYRLYEKAVVTI